MEAEETAPVASRDLDAERLSSSLELWLRSPDGSVRVFPFVRTMMSVGPSGRARTDLELPSGPRVTLTWDDGKVAFANETPLLEVLHNGEPATFGPLEVGGTLELGGYHLELWDREGAPAYLEGYSEPFAGRLWALQEGRNTLGRPGARENSVSVDHRTVSRAHASLLVGQECQVEAESSTNPVVLNSVSLSPGSTAGLSDGDLLEVGELLFRFHRPARRRQAPAETGGVPALRVQLFGTFSVEFGESTAAEKLWRTQNVKWLAARLAHARGTPVGVEAIIDMLWPDLALDKGRKNLNFIVYALRHVLRTTSGSAASYLLRGSQTLQLNPEYLGESDLALFEKALLEDAPEQALAAYAGPFLEGCYLEWALGLREHYHLRAMEAGRSALRRLAAEQAWDRALLVGVRLLGLDACCQLSTQLTMAAHTALGNPVEALRLYESSVRQLRKELNVEPSVDVLREFHRAQALL